CRRSGRGKCCANCAASSRVSSETPGRRELSRRGLLGPEEGWSLAPVAAWLAIEGRSLTDVAALMTGLAGRLDAVGAQVDRMGISVATLHPQMLAWNSFWRRGEGVSHFKGRHGAQNSDAYVGSPLQYVREQRRALRRRIEALDEKSDHSFMHEMQAAGMTDYFAVPLIFGNGTVNVFTLATRQAGGFSDA